MSAAREAAVRDLESRVIDDHHQAVKLWLRLLACTTRVEAAIRSRLRREFDTTLPRFDLMAQLEREPQGLTMGELSQRLMVTGGNVTGITDQLEAEGLAKRVPRPGDRRAWTVRLTPHGRRQFLRMAAVHEQWVIGLFAGWSVEEKRRVYASLADLKRHLAGVDRVTRKRRRREKA